MLTAEKITHEDPFDKVIVVNIVWSNSDKVQHNKKMLYPLKEFLET